MQFGGKDNRPVGVDRVIERLLAGAIARQNQASIQLVVNRDREHAAQLFDEGIAVLVVEVNDDFGVRVRLERVALALEPRLRFAVVVDLAVENTERRSRSVGDGLRAVDETDHFQPADAERTLRRVVETHFVRTTMHEAFAHPRHALVRRSSPAESHFTGYATHQFVFLFWTRKKRFARADDNSANGTLQTSMSATSDDSII